MLFYLNSNTSWYEGGPARTAAFGGIEIILPDSSTPINLFSEGFGSGVFSLDWKNIVSLSTVMDYFIENWLYDT